MDILNPRVWSEPVLTNSQKEMSCFNTFMRFELGARFRPRRRTHECNMDGSGARSTSRYKGHRRTDWAHWEVLLMKYIHRLTRSWDGCILVECVHAYRKKYFLVNKWAAHRLWRSFGVWRHFYIACGHIFCKHVRQAQFEVVSHPARPGRSCGHEWSLRSVLSTRASHGWR